MSPLLLSAVKMVRIFNIAGQLQVQIVQPHPLQTKRLGGTDRNHQSDK